MSGMSNDKLLLVNRPHTFLRSLLFQSGSGSRFKEGAANYADMGGICELVFHHIMRRKSDITYLKNNKITQNAFIFNSKEKSLILFL